MDSIDALNQRKKKSIRVETIDVWAHTTTTKIQRDHLIVCAAMNQSLYALHANQLLG